MFEVRRGRDSKALSSVFATCCIVDLFGVFPVIALPRAIVECGWLGIPMAFTVFFIQIYTALLLGRCWVIAENLKASVSQSTRSPYATLAELAYGSGMSKLVSSILGIAVFGGGVPNILIAAQNLQLIGLKLTANEFDLSYCYWMVIIGAILCPLMWLGSPKDMKWLAVTSVLTVVFAAVLTWISILDVSTDRPPQIPLPSWESVAIAYGILAFQFDIHPMVLTVQMDMKNKNKLGHSIAGAFLVSGGMFLITCVLVYVKLGTAVHYNTLEGLPASLHLYIAVILVTIQICLSMTVGTTALFQNIEQKLSIPPNFNWKRCCVRSLLLIIAVIIAETVPRFDLIMGLIGGSLTGQLMFVFPPLLYIRLRAMQAKRKVHQEVRGNEEPSAPLLPEEYFRNPFLSDHSYRSTSNRALVFGTSRNDVTTFEDLMGILPRKDILKISERPKNFGLESRNMKVLCHKDVTLSDRIYQMISLESVLEMGKMGMCEKLFNILLMICGILATITSSFYTLNGTIKYGEFVPPCIVNVTLASLLVKG